MSAAKGRWTRPIGELFIIIVGVLIALAVDQWRASVQERELEQEYLVALKADLEDTRDEIDATIGAFERFLAHGVAVSRVLDGEAPFPDDTLGFLASALQVTRGGFTPAVSRGAYSDLISTGNLRVLENRALRHRLSSFYGTVNNVLSPIDYAADKMPFRSIVRGTLSLDTQLLIRAECDGAAPLTCPESDGPGSYGEMVRAFLTAENVSQELRITMQGLAIRSLQTGVTGGFQAVLAEIGTLLLEIDAEID